MRSTLLMVLLLAAPAHPEPAAKETVPWRSELALTPAMQGACRPFGAEDKDFWDFLEDVYVITKTKWEAEPIYSQIGMVQVACTDAHTAVKAAADGTEFLEEALTAGPDMFTSLTQLKRADERAVKGLKALDKENYRGTRLVKKLEKARKTIAKRVAKVQEEKGNQQNNQPPPFVPPPPITGPSHVQTSYWTPPPEPSAGFPNAQESFKKSLTPGNAVQESADKVNSDIKKASKFK